MGLRFRKRIRLTNWLHINLSKSGASLSIGPRGLNMNIGSRGVYTNIGIPGTGITSRQKLKSNQKESSTTDVPNCSTSSTDTSDLIACLWGILTFLSIVSLFISLILAARYSNENPDLAKSFLIASGISFILMDVFYTIWKKSVDIQSLLRRVLVYFIIAVCSGGICGLVYHKYIHGFIFEDLLAPILLIVGSIAILLLTLACIKLLTALICRAVVEVRWKKLSMQLSRTGDGNRRTRSVQNQMYTNTNSIRNSVPQIEVPKKLRETIERLLKLLTTSLENPYFSERVSAYAITKNGLVIEDLNAKVKTLLCFDIVKCYSQLYDLNFNSKEGSMLLNVVYLIEGDRTPNSYIDGVFKLAKREKKLKLYMPPLFDLSQKDECTEYISLNDEIVRFIIYSDDKVTFEERDMFVKLDDYKKQVLKRYEPKRNTPVKPQKINYLETNESELELKWQVAKYILLRKKCDVYEIAEDFRITLLEATFIRSELEKLGVIIYDGVGIPEFVPEANLNDIIERELKMK